MRAVVPNPYTTEYFDLGAAAPEVSTIAIPAGITHIDPAFFQLFPNLKSVSVADDNQNYASYNGMLFDAARARLLLVPEGMEGNAVLPDSLASVPAYAFSRCTKLSAITLSGSTGASAFTTQDGILYSADGTQLLAAPAGIGSTATIAAACTHIAEGAFWGNLELKTIVVNGTIEGISTKENPIESAYDATEEDAEAEANADDAATEPENETDDATGRAFNDTTIEGAMVVLNVAEDERDDARAPWEAAGFTSFAAGPEPGSAIEPVEGSGFAFDLLDDYTLAVRWQGEESAPEKLEVPAYGIIEGIEYKVSAIAQSGFEGQEAIQQVMLPEGIASIGNAAFKDAASLNTIAIPGSVSVIGDEAFSGCEQLVALEMGEGIRTIGRSAFAGIAQKAIVIPASVKAVGDYAFANSPNLEMVVALGDVDAVGQNALAGTSGLDLYVPYRADGAYAWSAGLPATGNHLMPYGVRAPESTIAVNVGEQAELFAEGYLEAPGAFEVSYAYKAKPISISDAGTIEAKEGGSSNVEVTLTLDVPRQVVSGIVSKQARLTHAAYDPNTAPTVQTAEVVEATQPISVAATASVLSVERATTGKTITFRVIDPSDSFVVQQVRGTSESVQSITFTGVTDCDYSSGTSTAEWYINSGAVAVGYSFSSDPYPFYVIANNNKGWTLDPSKPYATGTSFHPTSCENIPDQTTFWLQSTESPKSGTLIIKAENSSLSAQRSVTGEVVANSGDSSENQLVFYDVGSFFCKTNSTLQFNGRRYGETAVQSYTVTGTPYGGYEFRGFKYGLDETLTSLSSKALEMSDHGYSFRNLNGDLTLVGFATEAYGKSITINANGGTVRRVSTSGTSSSFAGAYTVSSVRKIETIYDSTYQQMKLRLYTSATSTSVYTEFSVATSNAILGWSPNSYAATSSVAFKHILEGTYYPNKAETITPIWGSASTSGVLFNVPSGWTVSTGPLTLHGYEHNNLYKVSKLTALTNGDVEVYGSHYHTLGAIQSNRLSAPDSSSTLGLSCFGGISDHDNMFIPGEAYTTAGSSAGLNSYSAYPVYKSSTVVYDSNIPTGATLIQGWPNSSTRYGSTPLQTDYVPQVNGGYAFGGFYTKSDGTGIRLNDEAGHALIKLYASRASNPVYAKWVPVSVTVTFNGNGQTSGSMSNQTLSSSSSNLKANTFAKTGYAFQGWATSQTAANAGTVTYADSGSILSYIQSQHSASVTLSLYAVWSPNRTVVNFDGNGSTGGTAMSQQTILYSDTSKTLNKNTYTRAYYTFKGWGVSVLDTTPRFLDQAEMSIATTRYETTLNLHAVWSANYVDVIMHPNGAEGEDREFEHCAYDDGTTYLSHNNYVRPGYSFLGWATSPTGEVVYEDGGNVIDAISPTQEASTLDLYAVWKAGYIDVPINYYLENADDEEYTLSESMSRTESLLVGQSYSPSSFGTVQYYTRNTLMGDVWDKTVEGDYSTEFNIYWDRNRYDVTFVFSGDDPEGVEVPASARYKHGATVTLPEMSSVGTCVFKGWSINDSTELLPSGATFIMPTRATTVTGVWEYSDKYTVVYDKGFEGDSQTGPVDSTVYHVGDAVTLAQNNPPAAGFTRDGYVFLGWSTTAGHATTGFRPGQQVPLDNWIQNGTVTLYAVWGPQVNVASPIAPSIKLMVRPSSAGSTSGSLAESVATSANLFTSQTPEDVLVSSMQCEPVSGENGTAKVFKHDNLWQFVNVLLDGGGNAQASLPLNADTSLRYFSMDSEDKFIIPSGGELPVEVDLGIPEYVQVTIVDDEVDIARLAFTFQLAQPTE